MAQRFVVIFVQWQIQMVNPGHCTAQILWGFHTRVCINVNGEGYMANSVGECG
jgi:hypothetical protein